MNNKEKPSKQITKKQNVKIEFKQVEEGVLSLKDSKNPEVLSGLLKSFGSNNFNTVDLLTESLTRIACDGKDFASAQDMEFAISFLQEINPQDPIETMLAIQMLGTHLMSCKTLYRASIHNQSSDGISENINRTTKLSRTYVAQIEALKKYRSKGSQKITVEHININDGGKAVIGSTINNIKDNIN